MEVYLNDTKTNFKTPTLMGRKGLCFQLKKEGEKRRREGGAGGGYLYSLVDCQENLRQEVFADMTLWKLGYLD